MCPDPFLPHLYQLSFKRLLYMMLYNLYSCKGIKTFFWFGRIVIVTVATCYCHCSNLLLSLWQHVTVTSSLLLSL